MGIALPYLAVRIKFLFYGKDFRECKFCVVNGPKMGAAGPAQILLYVHRTIGRYILPWGYRISHASIDIIALLWLIEELSVVEWWCA